MGRRGQAEVSSVLKGKEKGQRSNNEGSAGGGEVVSSPTTVSILRLPLSPLPAVILTQRFFGCFLLSQQPSSH